MSDEIAKALEDVRQDIHALLEGYDDSSRELIIANLSSSLAAVRTDADLAHVKAQFLNQVAVAESKANEAMRKVFDRVFTAVISVGTRAVVQALV